MALSFTTGTTFGASEQVTNTKLNDIVNALTYSGSLEATRGGTAQTTWAQGDILFASAANTLSKLAAGTDGQALTTQGASANPTFSGMTTQGDIEYHSGTDRDRLAVGTSGQLLKTKGASANPVWADDFNPQTLSRASSQTEGAGTETDIDFGATDAITVVTDGIVSVLLMLSVRLNNNDVTGNVSLRITDDSNTLIGLEVIVSQHSTASENFVSTVLALDTRPAASSKIYKARFNRVTAGTASIGERTFIAFTLPDPA